MAERDAAHDPAPRRWVASANGAGSDFPIRNLPFGVFDRPGETARGCIAMGKAVLEPRAALAEGLVAGEAAEAAARPASAAARRRVSALLAGGMARPMAAAPKGYSTVTLFARLRGWSTSVPFSTAT